VWAARRKPFRLTEQRATDAALFGFKHASISGNNQASLTEASSFVSIARPCVALRWAFVASISHSAYSRESLVLIFEMVVLKIARFVRRFALSSSAVVTVLTGCAVADFIPYSGQQQNWPTQPGSFVNTSYAIPAYISSYPNRPYNVIGYLDATTAPVRRRGVVAFAARRAKELGADAIVVLSQGTEYAGTVTTGNAFTCADKRRAVSPKIGRRSTSQEPMQAKAPESQYQRHHFERIVQSARCFPRK
jgi:hypothetical protein